MKQERSALAAQIFILIFAAVLLVMAGLAPSVARWYVALRPMQPGVYTALLGELVRLHRPGGAGPVQLCGSWRSSGWAHPFCSANCSPDSSGWLVCVDLRAGLRRGRRAVRTAVLVTAAMLFLFFVLQIVAACFRAAADLAEENRLTI